MRYLLGIDNGGTFIKAAVFDEEGNQIAVAVQSVPMITPRPGFTERDMDVLYKANCEAVKDAIEKSGVNPGDIACVGLSGHGKGLYAIGKDGRPAYNGIVSTDNRGAGIADKWNKQGISAEAFKKTFQSVLACQPAVLLAWLKEYENAAYSNIKYVFSVKDYIRFKLTGEAYAELTDVSGTSLLNLKTRSYDEELLKQFGISEIYGALPPLKASTDICGYITGEAARLTGLTEGTPVSGGMFDIDACGLACGMTDESVLTVIAGTWSINEYIRKMPVTDGSVQMNSLYCMNGYYLVEECSPTSIGNLEWFMENVTGKIDYSELNEKINNIKPGDNDLYYLPFIYASNEGGNERGALIGLTAGHTKYNVARAIYEGVVFSHKSHIDKLLTGRGKPGSVRLAGGASKSDVLVQLFADVLDIPIDIIADKELGCFGACMAAGVACGIYKKLEDAALKTVKITKTIKPGKNRTVYDKKYAKYRQIIGSLKGVWDI